MTVKIEGAGTPLDVESGDTSRRVKVHSRCAKDPRRLKSILEQLYGGGFTVEMRHNMYIINSVKIMDQRKIVERLLAPGGSTAE
ncbi:hypothetical protein C7999DRAFT_36481 [Corynascus novoguineensis]|uniref:Uncharacterized protein n=1 Tax=Corynascus novoguineensis TaxID=1126955 RepID=A0AAN7CJC6_9PEZI|nr:hypothetical protein C7999DRAFT_36481 [Corynascus novoguineensis]